MNAEGELIDHPVNDRIIAAHSKDLGKVRGIILASGGWSKLSVIRASRKLLHPSVRITDADVAERLILDRDAPP